MKEVSEMISLLVSKYSSIGKALRRAYQQQFNFRNFLQALAAIILIGTPHSTSEDIDSWQSATLLVQSGLITKKKKSLDPGDIEKFAKFSLQFEEANVLAPILSVFETQPSRIKTHVMSAYKKVFVSKFPTPASTSPQPTIECDYHDRN